VCKATFTHHQSFYRHRKNNACTAHGDAENPNAVTSRTSACAKYKEAVKELATAQEELKFLRQQVAELQRYPNARAIQFANTINNTTININAFGCEDISHIADSVFKELISKRNLFDSLQEVTKMVHFDRNTPQNMNVYLASGETHGFVWSPPGETTTLESSWMKKDADALVDDVMTDSLNKMTERTPATESNADKLKSLKTSINIMSGPKTEMKGLLADHAQLVEEVRGKEGDSSQRPPWVRGLVQHCNEETHVPTV
jgi:hypothetical protein